MSQPQDLDTPSKRPGRFSLRISFCNAQKWNLTLLVLALLCGTALRSLSLGQPLWLDEAWRAYMISSGPFKFGTDSYAGITPIGYFYLEQLCIHLFSNSEISLRLPSYVAGILLIPLLWLTGRKMEPDSALAGLFAWIIALNPTLVHYSKELKPYAIETLIHAGLLYIVVKIWRERRPSLLPLLNAAVLIALLFAVNGVIAWGAIIGATFLAVALGQTDAKTRNRSIAAAIVTLATVITLYFLQWRYPNQDNGLMEYWKDNFYSGAHGLAGYVLWLFPHTWNLGHKILITNTGTAVMSMMLLAATIFCWRRARTSNLRDIPWRHLYAPLVPVGVFLLVILLNLIGKWPYGAIRPNLFLYPYGLVLFGSLIMLARQEFPRVTTAATLALGLSLIIGIAHTLFTGRSIDYHPPREDIKTFIAELCQTHPAGTYNMVVSPAYTFLYYTEYNNSIRDICPSGYFSNIKTDFFAPTKEDISRLRDMAQERGTGKDTVFLITHVEKAEYQAIHDAITASKRHLNILTNGESYMLTLEK